MCNCQFNQNYQCIPSKEECGVKVVVSANVPVARVCNEVNYQVTVTNNSDTVIKNAYLTLPIDKALALMPSTVCVNNTMVDVENLNKIPLGDIEPGGTSTITYTVTVMTCQRYIKTQARVYFQVCCCFETKYLCVPSNVNCVQVCCCCCNN